MDKEWNEKYSQQDLQRLRGLRLMDDDFMSKCFENNIECAELVLHIVLGRDDLKVEKVETQHLIKTFRADQSFLIFTLPTMWESSIILRYKGRIGGLELKERGITAA